MTVSPADKPSYWGTDVADIQEDISVDGDKISGTLKYYDDETKSLVQTWGEGYFIALKFGDIDQNTTKTMVGIHPTQGSGLVELDSDKDAVIKVKSTTQKIKTVQSDAQGHKNIQYFDLSGITLEPKEESEGV